MAYYYDDDEREREEEERQREWQEWQNYVQSNSMPSTDYGAGSNTYAPATQSAGFGTGAQGGYYDLTQDEAKSIYQTGQRLGRTDFQTPTGDWSKPFYTDYLNQVYRDTMRKLLGTETKGQWDIAKDAYDITEQYYQLFNDSDNLGNHDKSKDETYSGAADKEYERLLGDKMAQYETYGKSAQELLDKMTGMGWKSDRQYDEEDAARLQAKYGKSAYDIDALMGKMRTGGVTKLDDEEKKVFGQMLEYMQKNGIAYSPNPNEETMTKLREWSKTQQAAGGTGAGLAIDEATKARLDWGKENREKVDKYQTSFLNINGIAQRVKKKGYESLDDDEKEIWQQALMAMGDAGLDYTDWMTGGNDDPAISKWLSDWGMEQATLYDDIKEIYPVRPETTSYQQGYINAYRQTPEGAKAWYEEAKGTKDEQKARDNLYFLQKEEEYAQVPNMPGFENVTLEEAEREMPGREYKKFMTDEQKRIYLYLKKYAEGSPAERMRKANDYLKYLSYDIDKKVTENNVAKMRELGGNGVGGAIGASAARVGTNMLAGQGFWEVAGQKFKQWMNELTGQGYEPINYYTQGNMWGRMASGASEGVMNQVDWRVNILGHEIDIFDFVYGTMMSGIDSAVAMAMGKGAGGLAASLGAKGKTAEQVAKWTGALILGSGAAQNAMIEAYERTGDDNQALMAGVVSGIFETLFEEWSIEKFFNMSNAMTKDDFVKTLLKNSATSAFTNFSEELNTEVANILYDRFAGGDASEWNNQIKWYTDRGLEPDEAFAKVCWDKTWQAIEAGAGGALMGLFFGATGTAQSYNATQKANSQSGTNIVKSGTLEALTQIAETFGEDSASGRALKAIQGKKGNGKNNRNVGALYRAIHDDLHSSPEMQETVRSRVKGDVLETLMEMNGITPNMKAAPTVQKADTQTQAAAEEAAPNHQAEGADETLAPTAEEAAPIAPAAEENAPGAEEAAPEHQAEGAENIPWNQPQALTPAQRQFRNRMIANENYSQAANRGRTGGAYYTVTMDAKGNLVADELHKADGSVEQVTDEVILKPAEELGYNAEEAEALMRPADQTQPTQQPAQPAPHPDQQTNPRTMRANEATTRQAAAAQQAATQQAQPGPVQGPQQQNVEQMQMLQIAAEGLSKMIAGGELSEQEMQAIAANPGAMQLMREMLVGDSAETSGTTENEEAAAEETAQPAAADEDEALPEFVRPVRRGEAVLEATERKAEENQNVQTQGEGGTEETTQPSAVRRAEMTQGQENGELRRRAEGNPADIEAEAQQKAEERQRQREIEAIQEEQRAKLGENKTEPSATRRAEMTQTPGELRQNVDEETKGRIGEEAAQLEAEKNRRRALEEEGKRREARAAEGEEAREEYRTPEQKAEAQPAPRKQRKVKIRSEANGQEHAIHAIKASADGSVQVTLDNGKTVDADSLDMDETTREFVENTPKGMDGEGAAAMINNFDETSGVKPGDYASGFEQYYQAGKRGRAFTAVRSIYGNEKLTLAQRQAAYEAGAQEAQRADEKADTQTAENAAKYGYETLAKAAEDQAKQVGVVFQRVTGKVSKGVQEQLALIDEFAKRFQLQIRANDTLKGGQANGNYEKGSNVINLALDAEEGLLTRVVSHEGFHYIADQMQDGIKSLTTIISNALESVEGYDLEERIREMQERYKRKGENLSHDDALEEICAYSVLDVVGSQEFIDSIYAEQQRTGDTGLVARIREWISKTAAALKGMLAKYSAHNTEARAMLTQASDWISTIQEAYLGAMEQITQNRTEAEYGLTQGAKGDAAVQEYQAAMEQATTQDKADQALDQLVTDLLVRTQEDAVAEAEEKDRREAEREEAREEYYEEEADEEAELEEETEEADEAEREERRAAEREEAEEEYYEAEDEAEYAEEAEDEAEYAEEEAEEEAEETDEATDEGTAAAETAEPEQQQKKKAPRLAQILAQRRSEQGGVRRNATITAEQRAAFDERTRQLRAANERAQRNLNEMTQRFAGALEQYGQGNIALAPALEGAGFQASDPSLNPAMTYAARQIEQSNRKRGKRGRVFDFKSDARATERTAADYSYQAMVAKPDMQITQMGDVSDEEVSRYSENTREFGREMRQNVIDSGDPAVTVKTAPNGVEQVFVKVGDIAKDVQVAVDSFRHSIGRQITKEYAQVCQNLTGILKNSIASNELNGREAKEGRKAGQATNYSTVLIGVGETENAYVPVRFIVDNRTWKMTDYDILATISKDSIKKEGADISSRGIMNQEDSGPTTPSHTMKVSDFLELVKNSANISAVLSKDVAEKMGFERPYDSKISSSLKFDLRSDAAYDMKGENIKEGVEDDADFWSDIQNSADAENALELVQRLDESMGDETKGKWEPRLSAIAQDIIDKTESKYGKNKLMKELRTLFSAMDDKRMGLGEKVRYLHGIMNDVMEQTIRLKDVSEEQQAVRALLKAHPFALTEAQKNELSYGLGARNFIRKNYGTIRVVADKGSVAYLEDLWNDLNAIAPGAFQMDVSHLDMPAILDAYLEKGKNTKANHSTPGGDGTLATDLTFQTLLQYYDIPTAFRNTQKLREEFRQKLQDYKNNYAQKLEERATASKEREEQRKARDKARNEISRKARYINTRLLNPTDSRHVPQGLQEAARRGILPMIEKTGVFSGADAARLRREYSLLKPGGEGASMEAARAYDPEIEEKLERLAQTMEGRRLAELTQDELDDVNDIMGNLQKMIVDANDMQVAGRKMKVSAAAEGFLRHLKGMKRSDSKILQTMGDLAYKNMTPTYYGDKVGGLVKDMVGDLMEDQNKWAFTMKKAKGKLTDLMKKYDVNQWINDKNTLKFTTEQGDLIELNRDEALALYATWKRETTNKRQNANHLRIGGFMYQKGTKYEGVDTNAPHAISAQDMAQVMDYLGETQMQFADEMVGYLSRDMAALGNETSMALYGYEKFGEGYYFPYSSDRGFLQTSLEADEAGGMEAIRNSGMTKATVRHASNPVVVKGFMETWADHVNKMAMYNAFAETTADLNSIYNYRTAGEMKVDAATGEEYVTAPMSLRKEMEKALGPEAVNYLKNLVKDINGGVRAEERTRVGKMLSLFKKGSVAGNLSVVLQQPSAFARAMNMVNPKYLLDVRNLAQLKDAKERMYKYSGVAIVKEMGRFDTATGKSAVGWMLDDVKEKDLYKRIYGQMDEWTGKGAEIADELTWSYMWAGIENEVKALAPDLEAGSEEFYQTVAQRFNDVMNHTQVYDSVMSKSQMMRGQSMFDKMVTSFMAEPTLTANMLIQGIQNVNKPGGKGKLLRAAAVFVNSAFVNSLLKSIATAMRKGGDDDDRTYLERYLGDVTGNFMEDISPNGILNLIPYARDIASIFSGYSVKRSDMEVTENVKNAWKTLQNPKASVEDKMQSTLGAVGYMLGVPVKNLWRDIEGVYRTFFETTPLSETSGRDIKYTVLDNLEYQIFGDVVKIEWDDSRKAYYNRMVDALMEGDLDKYEELHGYEEETNRVKGTTIKTGIKEILKERVLSGQLDDEAAVKIMADHLGDKESNAYNTVNKWVETAAHEGEEGYSYSKYGALSSAIEKGEGISEEVQKLVEHGTDKKSVQSAITSEMKPKYLALVQNGDTVGAANLKAYILAAYGALGLDRDKMNKNIDKWVTDSQKKK